ncbi:MAG: CBS domain-containing protein [Deltaproteobacteria bacterium]|nr:CBS domain-containing protein [Deltaproteobacteria bacterium]
MKCHDVMKQDPVFAFPGDSVQMAAESMRQFDVGFLPVCGPNNVPMGALTDRDIATRVIAENKLATTTVLDVMTRDCITVRDSAELTVAEDLMVAHQVARVMVVDDDGHLIGVISLSDLPDNENTHVLGSVFARVAEREARPEP